MQDQSTQHLYKVLLLAHQHQSQQPQSQEGLHYGKQGHEQNFSVTPVRVRTKSRSQNIGLLLGALKPRSLVVVCARNDPLSKRTVTPPPTPRQVPNPRLRREEAEVRVYSAERDRELPLAGTLEARPGDQPVPSLSYSRANPPQPPPSKRSRVAVSYKPLPSNPTTTSQSSKQVPISPPTVRVVPKGAASSDARRPPSFGPSPGSTPASSAAKQPKFRSFEASNGQPVPGLVQGQI